jgi:hypothetical protein
MTWTAAGGQEENAIRMKLVTLRVHCGNQHIAFCSFEIETLFNTVLLMHFKYWLSFFSGICLHWLILQQSRVGCHWVLTALSARRSLSGQE